MKEREEKLRRLLTTIVADLEYAALDLLSLYPDSPAGRDMARKALELRSDLLVYWVATLGGSATVLDGEVKGKRECH